jgi:hypothetical protein
MRCDRIAAVEQSHQIADSKAVLPLLALAMRAHRGERNGLTHDAEATYNTPQQPSGNHSTACRSYPTSLCTDNSLMVPTGRVAPSRHQAADEKCKPALRVPPRHHGKSDAQRDAGDGEHNP